MKSMMVYFKVTLLLVVMLSMSACGGLSSEDRSSQTPPRTVVEKAPTLSIKDQNIDQGQVFSYALNEAEDVSNINSGENYTITIIDDDGAGVTYDPSLKSFSSASSNLAPRSYIIIGSIVDNESRESLWTFNLIIQKTDNTAPTFHIAPQTISEGQTFVFTINDGRDLTDLRSGESYTMSINNDGGTGILYVPSSKTFVGNTASLSPGTYTISGSITDVDNNSSDWSFNLTVQPASTIDQTAPRLTIAPQSIDKGSTFSYLLSESNDITNGNPNENYTITITHPNGTGLTYNSNTKTFNGATASLEVGVYTVAGTISDDNNNESTWVFNLIIQKIDNTAPNLTIPTQTISQGQTFFLTITPNADIVDLRSGESYMIHITDNGGTGMLYTSQSQTLVGKTAALPPATYTIQGTIVDGDNNSSGWSFDLVIPQAQPGDDTPPYFTITTQTINQGEDFSYQLQDNNFSNLEVNESYTIAVTHDNGTQVTYRGLTKSLAGDTNSLGPGTYAIIGTITDSSNNSSTWAFTLNVIRDDKAPELRIPVQIINQGQDLTYTLNENEDISNLDSDEGYTIAITEKAGTRVTFDNIAKVFEVKASSLPPETYLIRGVITDTNNNSNIWVMALTITPDNTPPQLHVGAQTSDQDAHFTYTINEIQDISNVGDWESYTLQITDKGGTEVVYSETSKTFRVPTDLLLAGTYSIRGTITDDYSNSSTWALSLTIQQSDFTTPILNLQQQRVEKGVDFTYTLNESTDISSLRLDEGYTIAITDSDQSGVTYNAASKTFQASTSSLSVGTYTIAGTLTDDNSNASQWSFNLRISDQVPPQLLLHSINVYVGEDFSLALQQGQPVFQIETRESFTISITNDGGTGVVYDQQTTTFSASTSTLSQDTYTIEGTITDGDNNEATWSIDLIMESPSFLWKSIDLGSNHTCAIKNNNEVLCWGLGNSGALGNNSNNNSLTPTAVVDGEGSSTPLGEVQSISAGSSHTCAIKTTGHVLCWGVGIRGELGNGTWNNTNYPAPVVGEDSDNNGAGNGSLSDIRQVSAGGYHTCAIKNTSGLILCWGSGSYGRLGNSESQSKSYPVPAKNSNGQNLTGMIQVSSGIYHTCAIKADKGVLCWGNPDDGRLGHGSTTNGTLAPVTVAGIGGLGELSNITQVSAGEYHTCALKADKSVVCWGGEDGGGGGALGYGSYLASHSPVAVINEEGNGILTNITQVSAGSYHTCALKEGTKEVLCWGGEGFAAALGHGETTDSTSPVYVREAANSSNNFSGADQISGGAQHTCVTKNNQAFCWGRGKNGQLGQGNKKNSNVPLAL